jgi:threonyl-tRNA synthetase
MIKITLPDKSKIDFKEKLITPLDVAKKIGDRLAKAALAAVVNNELVDVSHEITENAEVKIITFKDKEGIDVFRHSSSHILAAAVQKLFPETKFAIGPAVEEGFYYDFDVKDNFTPEDLTKIEEEMNKIIKENLPFARQEISVKEALQIFKGQPYKLEMIRELNKISVYSLGSFVDLCKGPHVPSSGMIKAVKLTKLAGAYWHGDSKNKQLQRVYGISFPEKKELDNYLKLLEEAEKRDHRKIGKEQGLFMVHELAPGMQIGRASCRERV